MTDELLELFHPVVGRWFRATFGDPTPAQSLGWPHVAVGEHTLILAPTGSGKTLAAFLISIDALIRRPPDQPRGGVHTLYVSPLRALGYDIERNLRSPLAGIRQVAAARGVTLPELQVGVRTGDTPQAERRRLARCPPDILITTPESLHLLLTSPRAREGLRTVRCVIVDEIHALCSGKRGTFLSLLLARLEDLCGRPFQRVGLSATQHPLEDVARFLGGYEDNSAGRSPRPVCIVDAGMRREMELAVVAPCEDMAALPEGSIWPAIYRRLLELIQGHRSTIVFVNNRRAAERITAELNELAGYQVARVHHGSVAKERRRELEERLKAGQLPALVATASLELGIDMGVVDLVCQVESPRSVSRALQRVGRAGHLYRTHCRGRLVPKSRLDLLEMAALAQGMREAAIAPVHIPSGCLDVLAQQVVAVVAQGERPVGQVHHLVRRAWPYRNLPEETFRAVVAMVSGRVRRPGLASVPPRISWDRARDVLCPLPGTRHLVLTGGGAVPDSGQYEVYTESGERIGELDEEFVYEARVGEVLVLGTQRWRMVSVEHDRVVVAPGEGPAKLPFWRGELYSGDVHFGRRVGLLAREVAARLEDPGLIDWLRRSCVLEPAAAENLAHFVAQQQARGAVPTDRWAVIEGFPDQAGGLQIALLTPLGGRFHLAWRLAILAQFRRRLGIHPDSVHGEWGFLLRLTGVSFAQAVEVVRGVDAAEVGELVREEVAGSPLFGLRFRQAAARALLLPRPRPGRRIPLWLQRLRARDLLEGARGEPAFPLVTEAFREVLADDLPLGELAGFLRDVASGEVDLVVCRNPAPSPLAAAMLFEFQATYQYQWDEPKGPAPAAVDEGQLAALLDQDLIEVVEPEAVAAWEGRFRGWQRAAGRGQGRNWWSWCGGWAICRLRRWRPGPPRRRRPASPTWWPTGDWCGWGCPAAGWSRRRMRTCTERPSTVTPRRKRQWCVAT
ncbi:MAG: DEAD/DEAH box helicase [Candidatus Bipolaricaulaceae bacterium]